MNRSQERVHPPPFHDLGLLDILNTWLELKLKKNYISHDLGRI